MVRRGQDPKRNSTFSDIFLWLARYRALEVVAARKGDHLLSDVGMSRDQALTGLGWPAIVSELLRRDERRKVGQRAVSQPQPSTERMKLGS
jgi:hypothetical protein